MKLKTRYQCQSCGYTSPKWLGRCSGCGEWNSLIEERVTQEKSIPQGSLAALRGELKGPKVGLEGPEWVPLEDVSDGKSGAERLSRISTSIKELDRVLGGGLVSDSFVLLGGDPGIGKSTLLLQMAGGLIRQNSGLKILYVSGEESVDQIKGRAHRLKVTSKDQIYLAAETQLEKVFASVKKLEPDILIMDSLQTFASAYLESAPGSVSQVREVAARLMTLAKATGIAVWIVGHVTKDGGIAGPKVIEHMVDTVLYFEGDAGRDYRLLRSVKNRFGSSRELGVFEMAEEGLREVSNPSSLFLSERRESVSGTAVACSMEGTRPLLVELQALVSSSPLALPRRTSVGMESTRVALLAAILERHLNVSLAAQDLYFNVAGGLKLNEPACDLAAAAAIWSSAENIPLPSDWIFVGEVGLTGEIRKVSLPESRLEEAAKLGFKKAVVPVGTMDRIKKKMSMELIECRKISDLREIKIL